MAEVASAFVSLMPSAKGFGSKLESEVGGDIQSSGKRLGSSFGKMFAVAGGVLAAAGIGSFLKDSVGEAREAQKVGALTESIIKSTGGAAKISAGQVADLAGAISLKTGMDDEAIQSGANLLLTFKNVKREGEGLNDVFGRATSAAADLSAAGFGDMAGQSKMLGKALNDPIKGISALSRSGVTFTAQQQDQIKAMVEAGNVLGAQKVILKEVESQVGGAAAASATAGEKAAVAFGNLKEQIGTAMLPAIDAAANAFLRFVPTIQRGIAGIGPLFAQVGTYLAPFVSQVQSFFGGSGKSAIQGFITTVVTGFRTHVVPVIQQAALTFQTVVLPAITSLVKYVGTALLPVFRQLGTIIQTRVLPIVSSLALFFYGTLYPAVFAVGRAVAQNLKPIFDQFVATVRAKVLPSLDRLLATFQKHQPTIERVIAVVVKATGKVLVLASAVAGKVLPILIRFNGFIGGALVSGIIKAIGVQLRATKALLDFGRALVNGVQKVGQFASGLEAKMSAAVATVRALPDRMIGALGDIASRFYNAGSEIMSRFGQGILDKGMDAYNKVKSIAGKIAALVPGSPVKEGPLRSFNKGKTGVLLMDMLARGIEKGGKKPREAMQKALDKLRAAAQKKIDALKSTLSGMRSFASGVADAFRVDLFSGNLNNFFQAGAKNNATVSAVITAFKKLTKAGLNKGFLSSLIQSGNSGLILELAAADKATQQQAASMYGTQNALTAQLGNYAAELNSGKSFKGVEKRLDRAIERLDKLPEKIGKHVGREVNGAASKGKRNQKAGAK